MAAPSLGVDRLEQRLRELLGARVHSDPGTRSLYTSDASLYRALPALVAEPADVEELAAIVRICGETGTSLTMPGAGTSIGMAVVAKALARIPVGTEGGAGSAQAWIHQNLFESWAGPINGSLVHACAMVGFWWFVAYALHRRGWTIKV